MDLTDDFQESSLRKQQARKNNRKRPRQESGTAKRSSEQLVSRVPDLDLTTVPSSPATSPLKTTPSSPSILSSPPAKARVVVVPNTPPFRKRSQHVLRRSTTRIQDLFTEFPTPPLHQEIPSSSESSSTTQPSPPKPTTATRKQIQAKKFYLTFPQSGTVTREEVMSRLSTRIPTLSAALVAQEFHSDGSPHLHVMIFSSETLRYRDPHFWDFLVGKHGNYQVMKSPQKCYEYCTKADPTPLKFGNIVGSSQTGTTSKSDMVAKTLATSGSLQPVLEEYPGFSLLHYKQMVDFHSLCLQKKHLASLPRSKNPIVYNGNQQDTKLIIDWLNANLYKSRQFKAPQLFISSPPDFYKSSLINALATHCSVCYLPMFEDFYDSFYPEHTDLIFLDEFKGQKTVQFMNSFLQGGTVVMRKKNAQFTYTQNLPIIIASNFTLEECYSNLSKTPGALSSLYSRLKVFHLTLPLDLGNVFLDGKSFAPWLQPELQKVDSEETEDELSPIL